MTRVGFVNDSRGKRSDWLYLRVNIASYVRVKKS